MMSHCIILCHVTSHSVPTCIMLYRFLGKPGHVEKRFPVDRKKLERLIVGELHTHIHTVLLCLVVCFTLLAFFFLPSLISH